MTTPNPSTPDLLLQDTVSHIPCYVTVLARWYDIPYGGIVERDGFAWVFNRVRDRNDDDYFLLIPVLPTLVKALRQRLLPSIRDVDDAIALRVAISTIQVCLPVEFDHFSTVWNDFISHMADDPVNALIATVDVAVSEVEIQRVQKRATTIAMNFRICSKCVSPVPKMDLLLFPSGTDVPLVSESMDSSQEMPF